MEFPDTDIQFKYISVFLTTNLYDHSYDLSKYISIYRLLMFRNVNREGA